MNCLSIIRGIFGCSAVAGFIIMVATICKNDYVDALGQYYPISEMFPEVFVGLAMFLIGWLMCEVIKD